MRLFRMVSCSSIFGLSGVDCVVSLVLFLSGLVR